MPREAKPVHLDLGALQANILIDALSERLAEIAEDCQDGDSSALREQEIAVKLRGQISRQLKQAGKPSRSW